MYVNKSNGGCDGVGWSITVVVVVGFVVMVCGEGTGVVCGVYVCTVRFIFYTNENLS